MILLDTHIWVWWVHGDGNLPTEYSDLLQQRQNEGLGISIISCWEIAKLVEHQRLILPCPIKEWLTQALAYPNIQLLNLTPQIAVESTQLPQPFHRDPADQLIVATSRIYGCSLMTLDGKIRSYSNVSVLPLN
ncbi:MAG: type II toxin-antitoxin system VapC family toxin [Methylococcaceae bacterium]|nr:type II toxin-antitoxin system VapC family toxin [Methylococcaceae bacterium]